MELKAFVSSALTQIVEGVADAQKEVGAHGAKVNPYLRAPKPADQLLGHTPKMEPVFLIDFDVAVVVTEGSGTKGGIGVVAGPIALGSRGESSESSSSHSRIRFQVPLALPFVEST